MQACFQDHQNQGFLPHFAPPISYRNQLRVLSIEADYLKFRPIQNHFKLVRILDKNYHFPHLFPILQLLILHFLKSLPFHLQLIILLLPLLQIMNHILEELSQLSHQWILMNRVITSHKQFS